MLRLHLFLFSFFIPLWMMAQVVVVNTNDSGPGSLRAAILAANADPAIDYIGFNIPGAGPHTITPLTSLPAISDAGIVIDGTSQPGYTGTPLITIDGTNLTIDGLTISSDFSIVKGLKVINCGRVGILLFSCDGATIQNNIVLNNGAQQIRSDGSTNAIIENNLINIDENGVIGTIGNTGIWLQFITTGCIIRQNTIAATNNPTSGLIVMITSGVSGTVVIENYIGTNASGANIGNPATHSVYMQESSNNRLELNTIAFGNIGIVGNINSLQNLYSSNNFRCNETAAINNSAGSNLEIAPPTITSAFANEISGTSAPNAMVELYVQDNTACPSSTVCQGDYLQTTTANGSGDWVMPVNLPSGAIVTALQIDPANNNTSPLGDCATVVNNDLCTEAIAISDGVTSFSSTGATGIDLTSCTVNDFRDIWYAYTATCDGNLTVNTFGSSFDTSLAAFNACGGAQLACNDDLGVLQSQISFSITLGSTYLIRVAGYNGQAGSGTLTVTTACCIDPVLTGLNPSPNPVCIGSLTSINITGSLNDADVWSLRTGSCDGPVLQTTTGASFSVSPSVNTTYYVTAPNCDGTTQVCQSVTVNVDNTPPAIICPGDITVSNNPGQCGAIVNFTIPNPTDNCPGATVMSDIASGSFFAVGTTTVTLTATDAAGLTNQCTFDVTVNDREAPEFDQNCQVDLTFFTEDGEVCPADATISLSEGDELTVFDGWTVGGIPITSLQGCVGDNCTNEADLTITVDDISVVNNSTCSRTITVIFIADDGCGNFSDPFVCNYTFIDNTAPEFDLDCQIDQVYTTEDGEVCPADATISLSEGDELTVFDGWTVGGNTIPSLQGCVGDNCTNEADLTITVDDISVVNNSTCSRTITVTFIADDGCGNFSDPFVCNYTFIDNTAPEFDLDCQIDQVYTTEDGNVCPADATISLSEGDELTVFDGWTVGGIPITSLQGCVGDNCTNEADLTITVDDISVVNNSTCSRTITVTFIADDGCGNFSDPFVCNYTFIDNTAPEFDLDCQIDQVYTTEDGNVCPADATISLSEGDELTVFDGWMVGGIPITSLQGCVGDNCTNEADLTITVDDISVVNNSTCSRTITVTFIADDGCGNFSDPFVCNYTFIDNTAPEFDLDCQIDQVYTTEDGNVCPADATISLSEGDELTVFDGWMVGGNTIASLQGCVGDNCTNEADLTITVDDITVVDNSTCSRTITVTFIADDGCGNFSDPFVCNYTFIDNTAPEFDLNCQIDQVYTTENGEVCPADATISLSEGDELTVFDGWTVGGNTIASLQGCVGDNCTNEADLTITVDDITVVDNSTCSRTITVTFIADDGCGNFSDPFVCNYTFIDNTAPEFDLDCQIDQVYTTEDGNVCPADATISLSEGDELTVFDGWMVGGIPITSLQGCVGDNCTNEADLTITVDDITVVNNSTCSRTITVTFIADDGCGNFSDPFVCNYTFIDNTGPEVSFNGIPDGGTHIVECDLPSETWDPLTDIGELTITDNCSEIESITEELTQLYDGPCTNNLLTRWQQVFTVVDVCGNTTVYTLFTEIIDTAVPVFTSSPDDVTIECDETAATPELEALDACSEVSYGYTEVRTDGNCPNSYTLTRTWTATDGCGNASNEVQIVTVEDTTPPEIEFVDGFVNTYEPNQEVYISCSEIDNILAIITNAAVATDNCSEDVSLSYELADLGFFDCLEFGYIGAYISTWKAIDACGNITIATINWFLVDDTPPVLLGVPEDTCADAGNLPPVAEVEARDVCEFAELSFNESAPIDCEGGQYIERSWTATDLCGNTVTATQTIVLSGANSAAINIDYPGIEDAQSGDTIEIAFDCEQDIAAAIEELEASISVNGGCSSVESSVNLSLVGEGSCEEEGYIARYQLNIMANDPCSGEAANLSLTIDFVDQKPPLVTAPAAITLNCGDEIPLPTAVDDCGGVADITFLDSSPIAVSCSSEPVAYQRSWSVSDACGNTVTFVQSITVLDNEGPVFSNVPDDNCDDTSLDAEAVTAFDTCTGENVAVQLSEIMNSEDGCGELLTRTWTATDVCGNMSTATQQVFFADETAPEMVFNNDLLFGLESGGELYINVGDGFGDPNDPLFFTANDVLVTDNCASITAEVAIEITDSEDCSADGFLTQYDYVFTATDPCGNTSSVKLTVFYLDKYGPDIFNAPGDVEVICDAIPEVAEVIVQDDFDEDVEAIFTETQTTTDEGLLITRTWTATDDCGNTNAVSQDILVVDNDLAAEFSLNADEIECNSDNNGLQVTASGGTPPYSYAWTLTNPLEDGFITSESNKRRIRFTMGYISQTFTVIITDANGCELTASTTVTCDFSDDEGDFLISGEGSSDYFELNTYPNPANQSLRVTFTESHEQAARVGLYSLLGQELYQESFQYWPQEGIDIDTRQLPNGTYLLRVEREGEAPISREIVILH